MGDTILFGVLRMPYELAMGDELSRLQYWRRGQQAVDEIERLREALRLYTCDCEGGCQGIRGEVCGHIARSALKEKQYE